VLRRPLGIFSKTCPKSRILRKSLTSTVSYSLVSRILQSAKSCSCHTSEKPPSKFSACHATSGVTQNRPKIRPGTLTVTEDPVGSVGISKQVIALGKLGSPLYCVSRSAHQQTQTTILQRSQEYQFQATIGLSCVYDTLR